MLAVVQQNNIYRLPFLRFLNLAILFCRQLDSIHLKKILIRLENWPFRKLIL